MHYQDPQIQSRIDQLFNNMTVSSRISTAQTVAHDYKSEKISIDDFRLAELLLKFLINDVETEVRATVAEQIKDFDELPRDIALQLALDIEAVSLPILKSSNVFEDSDLVEIFKSANEAKQVVIASRKNLPELITEAISENGSYEAVETCLGNMSAHINECGYGFILVRYSDDQHIQELIVQRPSLPEKIIVRLCEVVSEEIRKTLLNSREIPAEISKRMIENAKEHALSLQLSKRIHPQDRHTEIVKLEADGRLTATLMLRSIILGDLVFFEACLSHITGISPLRITSLIYEKGMLGLKRLFDVANLPHYLYPAFKAALQEGAAEIRKNPERSSEGRRQTIIDRIARIYNFEENLPIESLMEKLLPKS